MRRFIKILLFLLFPVFGFSQGNISGKIIDSKSGIGLGNANVFIREIKKGKISNTEGTFDFNEIPQGKYTLVVSYIGYADTTLQVVVESNKTTDLKIQLSIFTIQMPMAVVTATRNIRNIQDIPNRIELISKKQIEILPGNNTDDFLRNISGVNVDRFSGIYSKNASITLRGLNSAQRTLILLDGIPMNKTDGGSINWSRIDPEMVDKIEVVKGPASALYGSNGMSGVINIITKNPTEQNGGNVSLSYGTYNTIGGRLNYSLSKIKDNKGFYSNINGFYRQGDGYILYPDSTRDSTDIKTYLREGIVQGKMGYCFNSNSNIEASYGYFDDKRGDGIRIYDPDGGYSKYRTHSANIRFNTLLGKYKLSATAFLQREDFHQQKESLKTEKTPPFAVTQYVLYNTLSNRDDNGLFIDLSRSLLKHHYITGGFDYKTGHVDASDIYYTSTDIVSNLGKMNFYALYLQDEMGFFNEHLKIIAGIRCDYVRFFDGQFIMEEPTATTSVLNATVGKLPEANWNAVSPKLSVQYRFSEKWRIFASYGSGFRPPMLDDLCRNGNISKGVKLANPYLKPEKISTYELGSSWQILKNVNIEPTVFYSLGTDFQYFVGTGDSIYAGTKMKPVLKRENVGKAEIYGTEWALNWDITKNIYLQTNYAHYYSTIKEFSLSDKYTAKDLTGKSLMEVAPNQFNAILGWKNKFFNLALVYHYKDAQWTDDENTIQADSYSLFDAKISHTFKERYKVSLSVDNILNDQFMDEKGLLGMGRFILAEVSCKF